MPAAVTVPKELYRYLGETERVVLLQRRHWLQITEPVLSAAGGLVLLGWATTAVDGQQPTTNVLVVLYLAVLARTVWKWVDWRRDLFVVTNYRLINLFGIISRKVAMMPLGKVTDMSYIRSPWGKLLHYGTFKIESAGQDQALSKITLVRDPDNTYRAITELIFKPPTRRATDGPQRQNRDTALPVHQPTDAWWKQ